MLVAEADLAILAPHRWRTHRNGCIFYACTSVRRTNGSWTTLKAHRLLMGLGFGDPREVDHIDGNGLNNLRTNMRVVNSAGNKHNQHGKHPRRLGEKPTSAYPGVCWDKYKSKSKWLARIRLTGRHIYLGLWDAEADAAEAYRRAKAVRDAGGTREDIIAVRRTWSR